MLLLDVIAGLPLVLKPLDQTRPIQTRENWFTIISQLTTEVKEKERNDLKDNTFWGWMRSLLFPSPRD